MVNPEISPIDPVGPSAPEEILESLELWEPVVDLLLSLIFGIVVTVIKIWEAISISF